LSQEEYNDDYYTIIIQIYDAILSADKILLDRGSQNLFFEALDKVSELESDVPTVWWYVKARALYYFERYDEALSYWNRIIEYDGFDLEDYYDIIPLKIESLLGLKSYEEAVKLIEEFIEKFPYDRIALEYRVECYLQLGDNKKTIMACEALWDVAEKDCFQDVEESIKDISYEIWNHYSECSFNENKFDKAESILRDARKYYPTEPSFLYNLSVVLRAKEKLTEALSYVEESITIRPQTAESWALKAQIHFELKNFEDSLDCLLVAASLDPSLKNDIKEDSMLQEKFVDNDRFKKIIS
tara:strand:+ start:174 stop:1070 length:897 start_codon:yes stop_codon:yes gene_type:complete